MNICDNETKTYLDLNPTARQESKTYRLNKLSETEAYFLNEKEFQGQNAKKKKVNTITGIVDTSKNYISSDYWRNFYCSIC